MRSLSFLLIIGLIAAGCSSRQSSLLVERRARGPLEEERGVGHRVDWSFAQPEQTREQEGVGFSVRYASPQFLNDFFNNPDVFGGFAGLNPYHPQNFVFFMTVRNGANQKIYFDPRDLVIVDDRGNQYGTVGMDYITEVAKASRPITTATRGMLSSAAPGFYGISLPVGKILASEPQGPFIVMKQSSLHPGFLHPTVVYDGLVAFVSPSEHARHLNLHAFIKTQFNAKDEPGKVLQFTFGFDLKGDVVHDAGPDSGR